MAKVGHKPRVQQKRMFSYPAVIVNREEPDTKVGHPATSPGLSSYMFGCGPRGEETLWFDMHTERLRKALEDPELRESAKFVIDAVRASMTRYIDWLTFTGMALKDYTAMNPPHQPVITVYSPGKDVMERARDTNNGSQLALAILEERLEL